MDWTTRCLFFDIFGSSITKSHRYLSFGLSLTRLTDLYLDHNHGIFPSTIGTILLPLNYIDVDRRLKSVTNEKHFERMYNLTISRPSCRSEYHSTLMCQDCILDEYCMGKDEKTIKELDGCRQIFIEMKPFGI